MCMGATCPTCSKKAWRGCGAHIPRALAGVSEDEWCTCLPRVAVGGKEYPPAAGSGTAAKKDDGKKDEL